MNLNAFHAGRLFLRLPRKWLLIMKITAFLLLASMMTVSASSVAQKITASFRDAPLKNVFKELQKQSGYDFIYDHQLVQNAQTVSVKLTNASLDDALTEVLKDKSLSYVIQDKVVTIKQQEPSLLDKLKSALNLDKIDVSGKIIGDNNSTLEGASVVVKGTNNAVNTDRKGEFTLKGVDPKATIVITFVGYEKLELPSAADMGTIKLKTAENPLDEVKVIAYGETSERLNVGDVTTITAKTIEQQPVTNVLQALEGQIPGLQIQQNSGLPGGNLFVQIRGQQSISSGTTPFYIIDGVPYTSQDVNSATPALDGIDPLSYINPSDIESISVLKDADATAIYGSRAANGAILITTKKGKAGKTRMDLNYKQGVEYAPQEVQWMNTQQYLQMRRQAITNDGYTVSTAPGGSTDITQFDTARYTNWEKYLTGNAAQYKDMQASVSGGNEHTQFLFSGGYHEQSTVFPFSESVPQGNVHLNVTNSSQDNRFKISVTASYSITSSHLPQADLSQFNDLPPNLPSLFNKDGSLDLTGANLGYNQNPLSFELQQANAATDNLISDANLSYEIIKNFKLAINMGYNKSASNDDIVVPIASEDPSYPETGRAIFSTTNTSSWIIEPQLTYLMQGKWGKIDALLGATFEENSLSAQQLNANGYTSDALIDDPSAAPTVTVSGVTASEYKYNALFSRINYSYEDKYIGDLTWRQDGSSRFGADNALHEFWSAGGAYIFSKEKVMSDDLPWLSFGKLRGSYGTTGNDQIGDYVYDNTYYVNSVPYQGVVGVVPSGLPNATIQWEETRKLEVGLELGFLKDRIILTASWYRDRSSNQLLSETLPEITGFNSIPVNLPATVQNTGWEFTINTVNVKAGNFSWKTTFNLTANQNKLISFPGIANTPYASFLFVGKPIFSQYDYNYKGVNPQTGLDQFQAANGQLTSNPDYSTDRTVLETPTYMPKFYGGMGNTFGFKRVELSIFFQFRDQKGVNPLLCVPFAPGIYLNLPVAYIAAWQTPGQITSLQKLTETAGPALTAYQAAQQSTDDIVNASYIRLSNVSLSYQLNSKWIERLKLQNLKIFFQAQNLLTITGYKNADPETQNYLGLPPLRVFAAGLSASL